MIIRTYLLIIILASTQQYSFAFDGRYSSIEIFDACMETAITGEVYRTPRLNSPRIAANAMKVCHYSLSNAVRDQQFPSNVFVTNQVIKWADIAEKYKKELSK